MAREWWDEWLASRDDASRDRARALVEILESHGLTRFREIVAADADETEFAPLAYALFLRLLWDDCLEPLRGPEAVQRDGLARRLVDAGADPDDVLSLMRGIATDTTWRLLTLMDRIWVHPVIDDPGLPGWTLAEVDPTSGRLTGRTIDSLHESVWDADPTGKEGEGFV